MQMRQIMTMPALAILSYLGAAQAQPAARPTTRVSPRFRFAHWIMRKFARMWSSVSIPASCWETSSSLFARPIAQSDNFHLVMSKNLDFTTH